MAVRTATCYSVAQPQSRVSGGHPLLAPDLRRSNLRGVSWARRSEGRVKRARVSVAAEKDKIDEELSRLTEKLPTEKLPAPEKLPGEGKAKAEDKSLAIVTGAISIGIGVLYLVGVTFLNSRGNRLEPPPPEAFGWVTASLQLLQ